MEPGARSSPGFDAGLAALHAVAARLRAGGVPFALGGSGLLVHLGLSRTARDWDLTTDAPAAAVGRALGSLEREEIGPNGPYLTERLFRVRSGGVDVEVMCSLAIRTAGGVCSIPTIVSGDGGRFGVPLASPEAWLVAYALIGREDKAALLKGHLRVRGADPAAVERLLREPLPADLAARLSGLAPDSGSDGAALAE